MRITTAATLALTVLLATTTLGAVAATPSAYEPTAVDQSPSAAPSLSPAFEQSPSVSSSSTAPPPLERPDTWQVIRIHVSADGTATWTIESRFLVTNDSDAETFDQYAKTVVSGQPSGPYKPETFREYVNYASESTGREMSIRDAGWNEPRIEQLQSEDGQSADDSNVRVGIISYSFTWTNFATVDDDRIHAGDALQTDDGPLLRTLSDGQRLVVEPPDDNYGFVDAPTGTENGALVWNGPHEFGMNALEITIIRGAGGGLFSGSALLAIGFVGLAIVVGVGSYLLARQEDVDVSVSLDRLPVLRRRDSGDEGLPEPTAEGDGGSESIDPQSADSLPAHGTGPMSGTELEFEEPVEDGIDPELLSDEERVLRLLNKNGGRMKQASIVSETGWSNAKVSQLLSKMDDEGEIEKLRIGRENLITLPGVDPTALD
ncbi:DUF7345 domain-containing protein [Natrinema halophilum]|uniref:HTH iclR-type domain-containing protein n=1 Tax=Natrinema halophilum TaxID=1699371 RepID=A0A7D5H801_9EURY|nr:hypothetical protein [Natrinema halophilum]QLG49495.1 hypothetical protein HYG82_11790 [Natrinema halophilum]